MLFYAFSVLSVKRIDHLQYPTCLGCGILCAQLSKDANIFVYIHNVKYILTQKNALFINTDSSICLSENIKTFPVFFVSIKINHIDLLEILNNIVLPVDLDADYIEKVLHAIPFETNDEFLQRTDALVSKTIQQLGWHKMSGSFNRSILVTYPNEIQHFYSRLYQYLDSNMQNEILIPQIATATDCSVRQFNKILKQYSKCSALEFVKQYRIERAKQYLISSSLTVTEISKLVGFQSIHYFSKVFKHQVGVPPREYRLYYGFSASPE